MNHSRRCAVLLAVLFTFVLAVPVARGLPIRAPQVPFNYAPLQNFFNTAVGPINVATDQCSVPYWSTAIFGGYPASIAVLRSGGVGVGIYSASSAGTVMAALFGAGDAPGSYALLYFTPGFLRVDRFDANSVHLGLQNYPGISPGQFQFYAQGPCGTWFGEDARNTPPAPQVLTYQDPFDVGHGFWLAFEACVYSPLPPAPSTFTGAIVNLYYIPPLDAHARSWGAVKALYR